MYRHWNLTLKKHITVIPEIPRPPNGMRLNLVWQRHFFVPAPVLLFEPDYAQHTPLVLAMYMVPQQARGRHCCMGKLLKGLGCNPFNGDSALWHHAMS
jgi:hypothetical protein